jgi:hypothetical protein
LKKRPNIFYKFILKITILIILTGLTDQLVGKILRYYYFKQTSDLNYRATYAIDSTRAELLVFGSSRANHHYVPEIFEDSLNLSFYNLGRDGSYFLYSYAVFKAILNRYTPKMVLIEMNPDELYYDASSYERLASLLPYYKNHPEIRSIIELKSPYEKYKLLSGIYPFNSSILNIVINNLEFNKKRKEDRKGYVPLKKNMSDTVLKTLVPIEGFIDTIKVNRVIDLINLCHKNNIRLIIIQSPIYANITQTKILDLLKSITKENNATFWNFANDSVFVNNPAYFQDFDHMNETGAVYFSNLLVSRILTGDNYINKCRLGQR